MLWHPKWIEPGVARSLLEVRGTGLTVLRRLGLHDDEQPGFRDVTCYADAGGISTTNSEPP